jgi:hypothetical protein
VQPEQGGQLVNDLIGRILYIQPEGLARLNEAAGNAEEPAASSQEAVD